MLQDIKKAVEEFNPQLLKGFTPEGATEKMSAQTGFGQIEPYVIKTEEKITKNLAIVRGFKPVYDKICQKVFAIKGSLDKEIKKAGASDGQRGLLSEKLNKAKEGLVSFKTANKLSESDIEKPLWSFSAILMMVGLTVIEMMISFSSLSQYFDGYTQLIFVNGGLGLVSSFLVMIAGQMFKQRIRIQKELDTYNNASRTAVVTLPEWIKEDPSIVNKGGKYRQKTLFTNFLIVSFIIASAVLTIIKFIEPLMDHNVMAYVVTGVVIFTNTVFFVAYEYIQYSGLTYQMRRKVDKKLKEISQLEEQIQKLGSKSVAQLEEQKKKQLEPLKEEYDAQYTKVSQAEQALETASTDVADIIEVVNLFESKLREAGFSVELVKLKDGLSIPEGISYPNPF